MSNAKNTLNSDNISNNENFLNTDNISNPDNSLNLNISSGIDNSSNPEPHFSDYNDYVKKMTNTTSLAKNMFFAFLVGGIICSIGQIIGEILKNNNVEKISADSYTTLILVFLSALLTGLNIYPKIGKYGGAGALVPITGFANSVASAAIEYKAEGEVFGIGCKIFTIAGPVILYGLFSSWVLGLIYWVSTLI